MDDKLPTLKEIARRLNVSVSTVSRALANHPRIGLRTKMRVQALAKELDYEPNAKAIFFKQRKTFIIGVILPYIREEFFAEAISGIEAAAMEHEYTILFGQSYDNLDKEKQAVDAMKKQRVDGLIISLSKQTNQYDHLQALDKYEIPVVYFDRVPAMENVHRVYCDLYEGTIEIVNWLVNRGHRRVAFINGPSTLEGSKERVAGYLEGISRQRSRIEMTVVETTDFSKESTQLAMEQLLMRQPDAIITFNDYVHMDAVQYAEQQQIRINKDITFVSYANLPITSYTAYPPLASIEQYPYSQGKSAMEVMMKILNDKSAGKTMSNTCYMEKITPALIMHHAAGP